MTISLPESSAQTTCTTQAASERLFDDFPSSCHQPQLARRRAAAALGRPSAAVSSFSRDSEVPDAQIGGCGSIGRPRGQRHVPYVHLSSLARGLGQSYARLPGRSMLACQVECLRCCCGSTYAAEVLSSATELPPTVLFSCRIVLIKKSTIRRILIVLRIVKVLPKVGHALLVSPQGLRYRTNTV